MILKIPADAPTAINRRDHRERWLLPILIKVAAVVPTAIRRGGHRERWPLPALNRVARCGSGGTTAMYPNSLRFRAGLQQVGRRQVVAR